MYFFAEKDHLRSQILAGWTFALVRDETKKQNPCLTAFERLPEQQRQFNMTMAGETLKTIIALGYHVGLADEDAVYKLRKFLTFETKRTEGFFISRTAHLEITII